MPQGSSAAAPTAPLIAADSPGALFPDFFGSGSPGAPSARRWTYPLTPSRLPDAGQVTCVGGAGGSSCPDTAATGRTSRRPSTSRSSRKSSPSPRTSRTGPCGTALAASETWSWSASISATRPDSGAACRRRRRRAAGGALPRRRSMRELSTQLRMRSAIGKSTGAMSVPGRARLAAVRRRPSPAPNATFANFAVTPLSRCFAAQVGDGVRMRRAECSNGILPGTRPTGGNMASVLRKRSRCSMVQCCQERTTSTEKSGKEATGQSRRLW